MNNSNTHLVAVVGIVDAERRVLGRIFSLSSGRSNTYVIADQETESDAGIFLVDRRYPGAETRWKELAAGREGVRTLFVDNDPVPEDGASVVRRPFMATRVLGALDKLVDAGEAHAGTEHSAAATSADPTQPAPVVKPYPRPVQLTPPASTASTVEAEQYPGGRTAAGRRLKALVVDDSLTVRKQVGSALSRADFETDLVDAGERALNMVSSNDYDVVLLDVVMPGVDGYEVCKSIKRNRLTKNTPVIMLTGRSSPFDKVKGKLSGCDSYLTKPVKLSDFKRTLEKCLHRPVTFKPTVGVN